MSCTDIVTSEARRHQIGARVGREVVHQPLYAQFLLRRQRTTIPRHLLGLEWSHPVVYLMQTVLSTRQSRRQHTQCDLSLHELYRYVLPEYNSISACFSVEFIALSLYIFSP
jgi:hypothetical protein